MFFDCFLAVSLRCPGFSVEYMSSLLCVAAALPGESECEAWGTLLATILYYLGSLR